MRQEELIETADLLRLNRRRLVQSARRHVAAGSVRVDLTNVQAEEAAEILAGIIIAINFYEVEDPDAPSTP